MEITSAPIGEWMFNLLTDRPTDRHKGYNKGSLFILQMILVMKITILKNRGTKPIIRISMGWILGFVCGVISAI